MAKRSVTPKGMTTTNFIEPDDGAKRAQSMVIHDNAFDPESYEIDDTYHEAKSLREVHTTHDLMRYARDKSVKVEIDARVLCLAPPARKPRSMRNYQPAFAHKRMGTEQFLEGMRENKVYGAHRESVDGFLGGNGANVGPLVGQDFIPLLGGPFYKNPTYTDYVKMHMTAFHAFHHDPLGKRTVNIVKDFVLGKGYRVDVQGPDKDKGTLLWQAFSKANDMPQFMKDCIVELEVYGEILPWKLPNNQTYIEYQVRPDQEVPVGLLPRWRLIDPSVIWEIVTYPEDIKRVLYYQWVAPTQFQIYTAQDIPSAKFIVQQIPADQVKHYKINCVSNEKRGRSDLFPALGYMKRLRDTVNYHMISDQKNSAWSIDTTVDGSKLDIASYIAEQRAKGTIPPAGSEFVHSKKITRVYNSNDGSGGRGTSSAWEECLNMIAIARGIPVSYLGVSHTGGGTTRAAALVGTEPVAKIFEERQGIAENVLVDISDDLFKQFGLDCWVEVTFPEIVTQDRSAKIKDILTVEADAKIKPSRAGAMVAKELGVTDYDYEQEVEAIKAERAKEPPPLAPPQPLLTGTSFGDPAQAGSDPRKPSAVTSDEKHDISQNS